MRRTQATQAFPAELADLELNKASAAAALTLTAREVHRWILTSFAETGRAPGRADLQRAAQQHGAEVHATLAELTRADVLALDDRGEIRAAYPFSPTPTRHRITWDDGGNGYAMCAIDALGTSAMLGVPVAITSTEPRANRTVTIHVDHDTARWQPGTAVVFAGQTGNACCPSVDRTCCHINFFTTTGAARDWAARNPDVTGVVLDQGQALAAGIAEFGALLRKGPPLPQNPERNG